MTRGSSYVVTVKVLQPFLHNADPNGYQSRQFDWEGQPYETISPLFTAAMQRRPHLVKIRRAREWRRCAASPKRLSRRTSLQRTAVAGVERTGAGVESLVVVVTDQRAATARSEEETGATPTPAGRTPQTTVRPASRLTPEGWARHAAFMRELARDMERLDLPEASAAEAPQRRAQKAGGPAPACPPASEGRRRTAQAAPAAADKPRKRRRTGPCN